MTPFKLAERYLDIAEMPGGQDNPLIQWWLQRAGMPFGSHDEVPWCGSFLGGVTWELSVPGPTFPARARYWLTVGREIALEEATVGWDVVVLKRGGPDQPGPAVIDAQGHVGLYAGRDPAGDVLVLAGNQGNKVSIESFSVGRILGLRRLGTGEV